MTIESLADLRDFGESLVKVVERTMLDAYAWRTWAGRLLGVDDAVVLRSQTDAALREQLEALLLQDADKREDPEPNAGSSSRA